MVQTILKITTYVVLTGEKGYFHFISLKLIKLKLFSSTEVLENVQVRFLNFIPMQFFHKSLHTP